jgi:hypothetical protein
MTNHSRNFAALAVYAASLLPMTAAQAQYYGAPPPPPLYPYAVQNSYGVQSAQPYAVQIAPDTYVIQRPAASRSYPYVRSRQASPAPAPSAPRFDRPHRPVDRALVEELRKRAQAKQDAKDSQASRTPNQRGVINTTKIVRDPPVVVETQRVVDDPPRVIERHIIEGDPAALPGQPLIIENGDSGRRPSRDDGKQRVIQADAEVTILGPDRMSIRLFRKGHGSKANARAN